MNTFENSSENSSENTPVPASDMTAAGHVDVVLVAEAFGFGPAAAACHLGTALVALGYQVAFAGTGHALDLACHHTGFAWVCDLAETSARSVATFTDSVIACMDLVAAEQFAVLGVPTVLYDALAWFWDTRPAAVDAGAIWVCQDFFGVTAAVAAAVAAGHCAVTVPALHGSMAVGVGDGEPPQFQRRWAGRPVVSFGGLFNPLMPASPLLRYARQITAAITDVCSLTGLGTPVVLGSSELAANLTAWDVEAHNVDPVTSAAVLAAAPVSFATPGLGHLFDASAAAARVCWLPSANDSQALQAALAGDAGFLDASVDWAALGFGTMPAGVQHDRCAWIATNMAALAVSDQADNTLRRCLTQAVSDLSSVTQPRIAALAARFPSAPTSDIASMIMDALGRHRRTANPIAVAS